MKGLMQDVPLALDLVLRRSMALGAATEVVSAEPEGRTRHSWREVGERAAWLAGVLDALRVRPGGRVATFAYNSHRHVELHLGVPCARRALHAVGKYDKRAVRAQRAGAAPRPRSDR
jgi:fatty-acyl-CoA synthase